MPAATVEVAHATVEWCHRIRRRAQTAPQGTQILMASEAIHRGFRSAFPPWFSDSDSETAGAARGAATKSGGWRSSGRLSCQSKPMVDEPVSGKAAFASLFTLTTCTLRSRTLSAAFCAAHETHFAGVTDGAGARATPRVYRDSRPEAVPEGCSRPGVGVAITRRMFERSARRLHVRCQVRRRCRSHGDRSAFSTHICESTRAASAITSSASSCARSRQGSSLRSDPLCGPAGLDDTCAQLEGSTNVMAEERRRIFPY